MATARENNFDQKVVPAADKINRYFDRPIKNIAPLTWESTVPIPGTNGVQRKAGIVLGYIDYNVNRGFAEQKAILTGLVGALAAVTKGEAFDEAKLLASVEAAAAAGVERALLDAVDTITNTETTEVSLKNGETA